MTEKIPSISKINELFQNKEMKPSELFEQVYKTASYTESVLHAHLELFYDEGLKLSKESDNCLLYTSPSPRDTEVSRMPSSA